MDGFGGFLVKHIPVKCEVCEKDILKDTISAMERRVATKPQNCRNTEEIEDESFKSEDKEDLRHTIGASNVYCEDKEDLRHTIRASNVYSLNQRVTSNDNLHENRMKIDVMNEDFEDDKDLDLRNQLRVSDSHRCQKKRRQSDDLREKIQGNTIKKLKEQLEISHQSQILESEIQRSPKIALQFKLDLLSKNAPNVVIFFSVSIKYFLS